jgi:hypothetical protein
MKKLAITWIIPAIFMMSALPAAWAVRVGERAPDFAVSDTNGKTQKLSDYAGKLVVLEWTNQIGRAHV